MNDVLPSGREDPAVPVSGAAVITGALVAYGAFALLISLVAAFANGAHSHQVLSAATWKQLGTGGGIVTGIALFVAWGAGGLMAARTAGRDGVRHGVWVFIVGVVLITVVGAAITWLPDTTAILRNLRLLGLPVRRNEWRDFATVAGVASIVGMAAGAIAGGWWAQRRLAGAPAAAPARVRTEAPRPVAPAPVAAPVPAAREEEQEPAFAEPSLFEPGLEPEPQLEDEPVAHAGVSEELPPPVGPEPEPIAQEPPAWLQFIEERERSIRDRDRQYVDETPAPAEPAPRVGSEPAPTFIEEPEPPPEVPVEPAQAASFWPGQPQPEHEAPRSFDDAWALPDDEPTPLGGEGAEDAAFPHPPPTPVGQPDVADVDGADAGAGYRAPPEPGDEHALQDAPEAPDAELDDEEREERRRQQEEAARAYEQMREDQSRGG